MIDLVIFILLICAIHRRPNRACRIAFDRLLYVLTANAIAYYAHEWQCPSMKGGDYA